MIGYKVVKRHGDFRFHSYNCCNPVPYDIETGLFLVYELGKTTKPLNGNGPLCLFKTLEDAKRSLYTWYLGLKFPILKCEYESSEEQEVYIRVPNRNIGLGLSSIERQFPGTVLATSITPLEVVKL